MLTNLKIKKKKKIKLDVQTWQVLYVTGGVVQKETRKVVNFLHRFCSLIFISAWDTLWGYVIVIGAKYFPKKCWLNTKLFFFFYKSQLFKSMSV